MAIDTDPVLLTRILRNLLSNAIKYTETGGVRVGACMDGGAIALSVTDTGMGIPLRDQRRIFNEYHQLNNAERDRRKGIGLGLAVVKRTAALLGLTIHLESTPGQGSTFTLDIPAGNRQQLPIVDTDEWDNKLDGMRILVVDDDPVVLEAILSLLQVWGCRVTAAESLTDLLEQGKDLQRPPDLLICDYRLPGPRNGIEAATEVRSAFDPELPVLLITGDTDPTLRAQIVQQGFRLLDKPVKPAQLRKVMIELLKR